MSRGLQIRATSILPVEERVIFHQTTRRQPQREPKERTLDLMLRQVRMPRVTMLSVFAAACAHGKLPPPLDTLCLPSGPSLGCYNDSTTRTFAYVASSQPGDPFHANMTLETCAVLCSRAKPISFAYAAVEVGDQCYCTDAAGLAAAAPLRAPDSECNSPCAGNPLAMCGGPWRLLAYNYSCSQYVPGIWADHTLPTSDRVADLVSRLSPMQLIAQLTQNGADVYAPGVQLPRYIVSQECLAGYDGGDIYIAPPVPNVPSSAFPQPVNLGNSWDERLVREIAAAISDEARAAFTHEGRPSLTCMSPNLNVARDPRWGRNVESFGEDPSLIASLGVAYITGIQQGAEANASAAASGYIKISAVPKHLGAYSVECYNASGGPNDYPNCPVYRSNFDAVVDDIDLRELYLPGWRAAITESLAAGLMCSYNSINGVPACLNGGILRGIVQQEWNGSEVFVISDADAVALAADPADQDPPGGHHYVPDLYSAAVAALLNGTTISLEDTDPESAAYATQLPLALVRGDVSIDAVRGEVRRALTPRFLAGLYDPPELVPWNAVPASVIDSHEHHLLARRAAAESFVLWKNDFNRLPLSAPDAGGPASIAVIGSIANCSECSINRYSGHPRTSTSVWDGVLLQATALGATAVLAPNFGPAAFVAVAAADVAIVVVAGQAEGESKDRQRLGLPDDASAFLTTLASSNLTAGRVILCVISGGAVDVGDVAAAGPVVGAIVNMGNGGMEAGAALADVLWGLVNPSGVQATTVYRTEWEAASDFLSMTARGTPGRGHRYLSAADAALYVRYPFGWGLSYSQWQTTVVSIQPASGVISAAALVAGANITLIVNVQNIGPVAGARVTFGMLQRLSPPPSEAWPVEWLPRAGFKKVHGVVPGAHATAELVIAAIDLSRWDTATGAFTVRTGDYVVRLRDTVKGATTEITVTP